MPGLSVIHSYRQLDNSNRVQEKPPEELIFLLLQKACSCVRRAVLLVEAENAEPPKDLEKRIRNIEEYGLSSSKTLQIITALIEMIDYDKGGELGADLKSTYEIIRSAAWKAFKNKNLTDLRKVLEALSELKEAWEQIKG